MFGSVFFYFYLAGPSRLPPNAGSSAVQGRGGRATVDPLGPHVSQAGEEEEVQNWLAFAEQKGRMRRPGDWTFLQKG